MTVGYATTNPYTNEVVETFPDATDADVDAALDKAHAAFLSWRTTSFSERSQVLAKAAALGAVGIKEFMNQRVITGARVAELAA
jgi:succinate-semialdehyde dehydrogenase/glutarate-semialdehyde dehydrogenase